MSRKPITIKGFTKGINLKGDCIGDPGFMRLTGFKFGDRPGTIQTRGGFADWDGSQDLSYIQGMKRWYREDGGSLFVVQGTVPGNTDSSLWAYNLSNKNVDLLMSIAGIHDIDAPCTWVDCGSQLINLPLMTKGRPYTIKVNEYGNYGGLLIGKLGLDPPISNLLIIYTRLGNTVLAFPNKLGIIGTAGIFNTWKYCVTFCYGTVTEPSKYGESAAGPVSTITLYGGTDNAHLNAFEFQVDFFQFVDNPPGGVKAVRIYRTLANGDTFYRVAEITDLGIAYYRDRRLDEDVDQSNTLPLYTGLPDAIRCGFWHPVLKRFFWFGQDGYFHWSAAGYPDINPKTQKMEVGSLGYYGNYIFTIQNNIFCLKEDGIFLVSGDAPNYYYKRISNVQCFSRTTPVIMPDGIYFLGVDANKIRVFRFNGNTAESISEPLNSILPKNKSYIFKKAVGCRVGEEYWLSLPIIDTRYCNSVAPFNNTILTYNYIYQQWGGHIPCQAGAITVFDGPGDSGEVFISESDTNGSASKGTFFRLEDRLSTYNNTSYPAGVRTYVKGLIVNRIISYGVVPAFNINDGSLERLYAKGIRIRARGYLCKDLPKGRVYEDDSRLQKKVVSDINAETVSARKNLLTLTGDGASVVGIGKVGHATCVQNLVDDYEITFTDQLERTGVIPEIEFINATGKDVEIEALEFLFEDTNKE